MPKHDEETFGKFISLTYNYMLGSNLVHMDSVAVNRIRERASRASLRRDSVEINHIFRLISTLLNLVMVKMIALKHYLGSDEIEKIESCNEHKKIQELAALYNKEFREIEKEFDSQL